MKTIIDHTIRIYEDALDWLRCSVGLHDWRVAGEKSVAGTGFTDDPADYQCGGADYTIRCDRCGKSYVDSKRGAWVPPNYPRVAENSQPNLVIQARLTPLSESHTDLPVPGRGQ